MRHSKKFSKKNLFDLHRAPQSYLSKALGENSTLVGLSREKVVLDALTSGVEKFPEWFQKAVASNSDEDRRGIDVVVHTDIGKIFLQVKGTRKAVEIFREKHPKGNIVPFIVWNKDVAEVRRSLLICIEKERKRILDLRSA